MDPQDAVSTHTAKNEAAPSTAFGSYRLLQRIGEGGMGEVWLAEQTAPVHRQVALKVIKAGMDTAHVVARFEAERQALALMDHPAMENDEVGVDGHSRVDRLPRLRRIVA